MACAIPHDGKYADIDQWLPKDNESDKFLLMLERCSLSNLWFDLDYLKRYESMATKYPHILDEVYFEYRLKMELNKIRLSQIRQAKDNPTEQVFAQRIWKFSNTEFSFAYTWEWLIWHKQQRLLHGYINIFPDGNDTLVSLAYPAKQENIIKQYFPKHKATDMDYNGNTISRHCIEYIPNIIFNRRTWDNASKSSKNELINVSQTLGDLAVGRADYQQYAHSRKDINLFRTMGV